MNILFSQNLFKELGALDVFHEVVTSLGTELYDECSSNLIATCDGFLVPYQPFIISMELRELER